MRHVIVIGSFAVAESFGLYIFLSHVKVNFACEVVDCGQMLGIILLICCY